MTKQDLLKWGPQGLASVNNQFMISPLIFEDLIFKDKIFSKLNIILLFCVENIFASYGNNWKTESNK